MIANITKGRKAVGAIVYDFGPGRRDEHINPRIVAGNVTGTPLQVARAIDHTARRRPDVTAPIWRTSLSLPDEDGILPDAQWADIATAFVADMGFDGAPWVAVRHGDDHIHLTVSRVDWSGQLLTDRWDYRRAREAADVLEEQHGLVRARDRFRAEGPQVRNNELEASNRRRGPDAAVPPEREELRRIVREVRDASRGLGREAFESGLADAGVGFRANVASTGRMNGYSFTLDNWTDGAGAQVWVAASKVAKDLRWTALHQVVGDGPPPAEPTAADRRVEAARATSQTALQEEPATDADVAEFVVLATKMLRDGQDDRGVLPADHPALSTDPAARILAQWQMKQAGQEPPAEPLPEPAASTPAWDDKRRRPYGRLGAKALESEIKKAQQTIARSRQAKETAESNARTWDGLATGAVTGHHVQDLHKHKARLDEAAPYAATAEQHRGTGRDADQAADAARKMWRTADRLKDLGRLELWREGTSRKVEAKKASTAGEAIHAYVAQAAAARSQASEAERIARQKSGVRDPSAEIQRVTEQWPQLLSAAQGEDQAHGQYQRDTAQRQAAEHGKSLATAEARLERLVQEQEHRAVMPEGQRTAEGRARSAAARPTTPKGRRPAGTGRRYTGAAYEQPAHLRQPPPPNPRRGPEL